MDMSSSSMASVFFTSTTTPLYSSSWSPKNTGQYAGTCIFLIFLAAALRTLLAIRAYQERKWESLESKRPYTIAEAGYKEKKQESKVSVSSTTSDEGSLKVIKKDILGVRPWRITQDLPRACVDVVIAGVGYLLMLAVMTFNVGYFMSVLGGTFVGSLVAGRYSQPPSH